MMDTVKKPNSTHYLTVAVLVLLLAYGFRIWGTTTRSLWFDEAVEYLSASVPFNQLPEAVIASNYQPPLFSYLLHGWIKVSIVPIWLRHLPTIFSMLTIVGLMNWARLVFGNQTALLAGGIIAVMPTEIYYAQDVGEYALMICMVTYSLYFLDKARRYGLWRDWILWIAFSVAAVYSHYGTAIVVGPVSLLVLLESSIQLKMKALRQQLATGLMASIAAIPLFVYFLPAQIDRVSDRFLTISFLSLQDEFSELIRSIGDTFLYNLIGWPTSDIPRWFGLGILALAAILMLFVWRKMPKYLIIWFIGTYAVYFLLVRVGAYLGFGLRYGLIFTPLLVIGITAVTGLTHQTKPRLALAFLGILIGLQIYAAPNLIPSTWFRNALPWSPTELIEQPFEYWHTHRAASDATFVYYSAVPAFRYYLRVYEIDPARSSPPSWNIECSAQNSTPVCERNHLFYSPWIRQLSPEDKRQKIIEVLGGNPERMWMVFSHVSPEEKNDVLAQFADKYSITDSYSDLGAAVYLMEQ